MKQLLLLLVIIPCSLFARREDPRIPKTSPYDGVKTMEVTYIFSIPKGNDTGMTETFRYNEVGLMTDYEYDQHLMKSSPYHMSSTYRYQSQDAWTQTTYKNKNFTDSIVVRGAWANHYFYKEGNIHALYEYRGDSVQEKMINGGDTIFRGNGYFGTVEEEFWDYANAGKFAKKSFVRSADTDTTCYLDAAGKCMVMIVNYYDSNFKPVKTEYYNYRKGRFDFMRLPYDDKQDMNFFLFKSKKGKWSYQVLRKYNVKGWLVEETFDDTRWQTTLIKQYEYTLY